MDRKNFMRKKINTNNVWILLYQFRSTWIDNKKWYEPSQDFV